MENESFATSGQGMNNFWQKLNKCRRFYDLRKNVEEYDDVKKWAPRLLPEKHLTYKHLADVCNDQRDSS